MKPDDPWGEAAVASGLGILDLTPLEPTVFEGNSLRVPGDRVFGGQMLAQGLIAAGHTVAAERHVHSLHAYFLRPGDATRPIRFEVELLRDGRSFSARRTHAFQEGRPLLSMISSFQEGEEGFDHSILMPEVPPPDEAQPGVEVLRGYEGQPMADFWLKDAPFDVRHVEGTLFDRVDPHPRAYQTTWMRIRRPIDVSELTHRALIVFGCDQVMLEPLIRRHGISWATPGITIASLDHAMWWHRSARADEWLLFVQDAPTAQGGRGLTGAWVFSEDGRLVASVAQEGVFRLANGLGGQADELAGSS
ncbi:MAG: acyl-CoA thioesterase II [Demequinaceae bacterium]|nr:acyl-CoA thioesterase II [Demequinaceae bacterium]